MKKFLKKYAGPLLMLAIFETIAVLLWLSMDNLFYLFNFGYIGCAIALGLALYVKKYKHARRVVQLLVGSVICWSILALSATKICRSRAFGITCSPACLKRRPSTMPWRRSSVRCFLVGAGAATPAGRPWSWTSCPISILCGSAENEAGSDTLPSLSRYCLL